MRTCKCCGYRMPENYGDNCYWCGMPCPPRSPSAKFFLSLLQCGGYFAFFFAVQAVVSAIGGIIVSLSVAIKYGYPIGSLSYNDRFNELVKSRLSERMQYIQIIFCLLTLFLLWQFMRIRHRQMTSEIKVRRVTPTVIVATLIFGITAQFAVSLGITFVMQFIQNGDKIMQEYSANDELLYSGNKIIEFLSVAVLTPILEETVFRGFIYNTLKKVLPTGGAVILSAVIFGVAHGNNISFAYATLLGLLLATLYERYDTIIVPMVLHFAFNGGSYLLQAINGDWILFYSLLNVSIAVALIFGVVLYENVSEPHEPLRIRLRSSVPAASVDDSAASAQV